MVTMTLLAKLGLDKTEFTEGLKDAQGEAKSLGSGVAQGVGKVAKVAQKTFVVAGGALTAFGAKSVKVGAEFDASMSQVAATMGKSMDEMNTEIGHATTAFGEFEGNMTDFAKFMGKNTAFSASQAAEALNYMALAGYDVQESMDMLPNVLNLAAAGDMDLARASDMVTDTQTAFGLKMEEMPGLIDEMAKAASTGNTSVEQLGDAFLTVGGLAQELNGGFVTLSDGTKKPTTGINELEIALTAMANAGIKGSEAGTHMRNMLLKLSSPTDAGVKQFEELGVAVFDTEGNMRSLQDIFGDLNTSLSTLTQEEKIQAISDLFNTRDLASAEALLNAVGEDWDEIGESILDSQGAAQKMADTQLDNLEGDVTKLKSAFEGSQIAVSDALTPALRDLVQMGTELIGKFTDWVIEHQDEISEKVKQVGKVVKDAITWLMDNSELVIGIIKTAAKVLAGFWVADKIIKFATAIGKVVSGFQKVMNVIDKVKNAISVLSKAMNLTSAPILLIVAGIALLVAGFVSLWKKSESFRNFWKDLWEKIKGVVAAVGEFLGEVAETIASVFQSAWSVISSVWSVAVQFFELIWKAIAAVFKPVVEVLGGIFKAAWVIIKGVWEVASAFFEGVWKAISAVFEVVETVLGGFFQAAWDVISGIFSPIAEWFGNRWEDIKKVFEPVAEWLGGVFDDAAELIKGVFEGIQHAAELCAQAIEKAFNSITITDDLERKLNRLRGQAAGGSANKSGLATGRAVGGVIRKGELAVLEGTGAEAVVPLDQNRKWVRAVANEFALAGGGGMGGGDIVIPVYVGNERLDTLVVKANQMNNYRSGGRG